jgi:hypothetical protein
MYHLVIFAVEKVTQKHHVILRQNPWPLLRKKLRTEVISGKKDKAEKAQSFAAAASASKQKERSSEEEYEDDKDKKPFMKRFMEFWKTSQKDKKAQKNKRKRGNNDTSHSEQNYPQIFKLVALKPKRATIGHPTTEINGETTVNGSKKPLRILIDAGSSSSIILKKFINHKVFVNNSRTSTECTALGGVLYTKK